MMTRFADKLYNRIFLKGEDIRQTEFSRNVQSAENGSSNKNDPWSALANIDLRKQEYKEK
jgi:hypothetical protein